MYGLDVPGNELELDADFSIYDRGTTTLTLDVDLRRSLREPENDGDDYRLVPNLRLINRSEKHPSELQSLMRNSHADFCLKNKNSIKAHNNLSNIQMIH